MVFLQLWYAFQTFDWDEVPNLPSTTIWFFNRRVLPETVVHSFFYILLNVGKISE